MPLIYLEHALHHLAGAASAHDAVAVHLEVERLREGWAGMIFCRLPCTRSLTTHLVMPKGKDGVDGLLLLDEVGTMENLQASEEVVATDLGLRRLALLMGTEEELGGPGPRGTDEGGAFLAVGVL